MVNARTGRLLCWATFVSLAVGFAAVEQRAFGEEPPVKKARRVHGRLPAHYAGVVNEEQREEIYKLQEEYKPKINVMQAQLDALKQALDEKISAVLTAEQKKRVEQAGGKVKAKKAAPVEAVPGDTLPADQEAAE